MKELKDERDALAARVQEMREALENVRDTSSSTRLMKLARLTLATPDTSAKNLARRDAAVREEMLDLFRAKHRDYANEIERELRAKADGLLKGEPEKEQ